MPLHRTSRAIAALCVLVTALAVTACDGNEGGDPEPDEATPAAERMFLDLTIEPQTGAAPLDVRMQARLVGESTDPERFRCPSLAWDFGNGQVLLTRAEDCAPDQIARTFDVGYTYPSAGSFEASVQLLAVDGVERSAPEQVLVSGPTATPAPLAAVPGPTIVIATPAGPASTAVALAERPSATAVEAAPSTAAPPTAFITQPAAPTQPPATLAATATGAPTVVALATTPPTLAVVTVPATLSAPLVTASLVAAPASPTSERPTGLPSATRVAPSATAPAVTRTPVPATGVPATVPATVMPPTGVPPTAVPSEAPTIVPTTAAPATAVPTAAATPPPALPVPTGRVLPADLYYVTADDERLWRLPASGGAPAPVEGINEAIELFDVSPAGLVAYTTDGALRLVMPGAVTRTLADAGVSAPRWSRDGRQLAYAQRGVWVYDLVSGARRQVTSDGAPLAWSADGQRLLVRAGDGSPAVLDLPEGTLVTLPIGPVGEGGWMPDRDVAWLTDPGLRLLTIEDTPIMLTLLDPDVPASDGFVRPDLRLLALAEAGDGMRKHATDLTSRDPSAQPSGPVLTLGPTDDFAWSPDGRNAAVAGPGGLSLLDPGTGAEVPLVLTPSRSPQWRLAPR